MTKLDALYILRAWLRNSLPVPPPHPNDQSALAPVIATAGLTGVNPVTLEMVEQMILEELGLQPMPSGGELQGGFGVLGKPKGGR